MTTTPFSKPDNVLVQTVDQEMILLNLDTEKYFALDDVGLRFWNVLLETGTLDGSLDVLETLFDADRATLQDDLKVFAAKLQDHGLLAGGIRD